ncbi:MAG: hypothetical protein E6R10_01155 [Rhodocyclaceae bacterium]|nr:MAG: hypothetical protein E6R10_01155 [Rhodocyclaceae bacterium]
MELSQITDALQRDVVSVVFMNVLLQQLGLPLPAVPTLLLAGSLLVSAGQLPMVLAAAIVASVVADAVWYLAGRAYGYRVLSGLCKLSINPASCVSQTEARFLQWGVGSLVIAKFVPGFSTVAPPIAGSLRMKLPGFLLAAGAGAALWAGSALLAGWLLRSEVLGAIALLDAHLGGVIWVVAIVLAIWLAWKLWQKYRFRALHAVPHITPVELLAALESLEPPRVLDLRGPVMVAERGPIPGAVVTDLGRLMSSVADWPKDTPIVTLCACPEDVSSRAAAKKLLDAGYLSVRPLRGGFDAWAAAGEAVGTPVSPDAPSDAPS